MNELGEIPCAVILSFIASLGRALSEIGSDCLGASGDPGMASFRASSPAEVITSPFFVTGLVPGAAVVVSSGGVTLFAVGVDGGRTDFSLPELDRPPPFNAKYAMPPTITMMPNTMIGVLLLGSGIFLIVGLSRPFFLNLLFYRINMSYKSDESNGTDRFYEIP